MNPGTKLDEWCKKLDELDAEVLRLVERRARLVQELAADRSEGRKLGRLVDGSRHRALIEAVQAPLDPAGARGVLVAIDAACHAHDVAPRVACVGPEGGFSYLAGALHFGPRARFVRTETPERALDEVARGHCDYALVTYETLHDGLAFKTIQSIASLGLELVGERSFEHALSLVGRVSFEADVRRVYATSPHLALVEQYLSRRLPGVEVHPARSVEAALELAAGAEDAAAIVPRGSRIGLDLRAIEESVADDGETTVRYGVVSRRPVPRTGRDATALLFAVFDRPGTLHDVLQVFKEKSCNLRRIQSRAVPGSSAEGGGWEYVFYVEVGGHVTDRPLVAALEGVKQKARRLEVLGSFPLEDDAASVGGRP